MTFRPPVDLLPIDFKELSDEYPNLSKYVHRTKAGVHAIDFKNPKALRELTAAVLWIKFQLRLEVPLDTLLPPIPNRLGYVAWTEHLTRRIAGWERCSLDGFIHGIDIGTGASCIYPLLACRRNTLLRFLALDIDSRQIDYAKENVKLNSFTDVISVVLNEEKNHILPKMLLGDTKYAFCMCNPPFYRNTAESHRVKINETSNSFCRSRTEMITEGGELGFLKKLLKESSYCK
ncbi:ribosomal RNA large subunit methyltransferase F-like protein, partial [Obelidium mucronatum]